MGADKEGAPSMQPSPAYDPAQAGEAWTPGAPYAYPGAAAVGGPSPLADVSRLVPWVVALSVAYLVSAGISLVVTVLGGMRGAFVTSLLLTPVNYAAIIVGIIWTYMVRRNADRIVGSNGPWGPVWAVVGWIIPLAYLVIPYLVLAETWRRTFGTDRVPGWFVGWWSLWVLAQIVGIASGVYGFVRGVQQVLRNPGQAPADPFAGTMVYDGVTLTLGAVAAVLMLSALPLWLRLVRTLSERQDALRRAGPARPAA